MDGALNGLSLYLRIVRSLVSLGTRELSVVERSVRLERFDYITVLQNSFSLITFK